MRIASIAAAGGLLLAACAPSSTVPSNQPFEFETKGFAPGATCTLKTGDYVLTNPANKVVTVPLSTLPHAEIWCETADKTRIGLGGGKDIRPAIQKFRFSVFPKQGGPTLIKLGTLPSQDIAG